MTEVTIEEVNRDIDLISTALGKARQTLQDYMDYKEYEQSVIADDDAWEHIDNKIDEAYEVDEQLTTLSLRLGEIQLWS